MIGALDTSPVRRRPVKLGRDRTVDLFAGARIGGLPEVGLTGTFERHFADYL